MAKMEAKYYKITPLEDRKTYIIHNIVSIKKPERRWSATQVIGSQVGFWVFENPIKKHEIDNLYILSDHELSGYKFDDEFDYISHYEYGFDASFNDDEKELLENYYEGGSNGDIGAAWLENGTHNWRLDGHEILLFKCPIRIDLIDQDEKILKKNVKPIK